MEKNKDLKNVVIELLEEGATYDEIYEIIKECESRDRLLKIVDKLGWGEVSKKSLPAHFIREYKDKLNWDDVSLNSHLNEKEMDEFADKVNWFILFQKYTLSGDILEKHQDKIRTTMLNFVNELTVEVLKTNGEDLAVKSSYDAEKVEEIVVTTVRLLETIRRQATGKLDYVHEAAFYVQQLVPIFKYPGFHLYRYKKEDTDEEICMSELESVTLDEANAIVNECIGVIRHLNDLGKLRYNECLAISTSLDRAMTLLEVK